MQPDSFGCILNIPALGWALLETWALPTSLLNQKTQPVSQFKIIQKTSSQHVQRRWSYDLNNTCCNNRLFRFLLVYLSTTQLICYGIYWICWLYLSRYLSCHSQRFFFNFLDPPCADVSSPGRMLKAFFISRCQSAYPFPDSRPDCSWTNSPLTVLLPPPFSYSVQTEVRVGWRWCASSHWPEVAGAPATNWRANCWDMRRFLTTNSADFVATRRKHVALMLRDRMFAHVTYQVTSWQALTVYLTQKKIKKHPPSRLRC